MRRRRLVLPLLVLLLGFAACGDDEDDDPVSSSSTTTSSAPTEVDDGTSSGELEAVALFQAYEDDCELHAESTGNTVIDPALFADATAEVREDDEIVVIDGAGTELLVHFDDETFSGVDGPTGEIPVPYSFSCPPDLFVGTVS